DRREESDRLSVFRDDDALGIERAQHRQTLLLELRGTHGLHNPDRDTGHPLCPVIKSVPIGKKTHESSGPRRNGPCGASRSISLRTALASRGKYSSIAPASLASRIQCTLCTSDGSRPRRSLCVPCAPASKRVQPRAIAR